MHFKKGINMAEIRDRRQLQAITDFSKGSYDGFNTSAKGSYALLGSADTESKDIVAVFFKSIPITSTFTAYHMYILVHSHRKNVQVIYRAGPTSQIEGVHAAVYFATGATPTPNEKDIVSFGYLEGHAGLNRPLELVPDEKDPTKKKLVGSPDFNATGSDIGVIIKTDVDLIEVFKSFEDTNRQINLFRIRYNPRFPNSNSYVTTLLKRAGLPSAQEAIDLYPPETENKEKFTNLLTPGASVIDPTVVTRDARQTGKLDGQFCPALSQDEQAKAQAQLKLYDATMTGLSGTQIFTNSAESEQVRNMSDYLKGKENVPLGKVDIV